MKKKDLFDFTSFFCLDFLNFLARCVFRRNKSILIFFAFFSAVSKPHAQRYITQNKFEEYSCDKGNCRFDNWSALKNHKNNEEYVKFGPKNNPCTLCPMKYCTKDLLNQHIEDKHSGEKGKENTQVKYYIRQTKYIFLPNVEKLYS